MVDLLSQGATVVSQQTGLSMTAISGLFVLALNSLALLGIAWQGGRMSKSLDTVIEEVVKLRKSSEELLIATTRADANYNALDGRISALEQSR